MSANALLDLPRDPSRRLDPLAGPVGRRVRRHRHALLSVAQTHRLRNVRVFGSVAHGQDRPDSDVDLLVDLPSNTGLLALGQAEAAFEAILGVRVDLAPASDLKPDARERVDQDAIRL